MVSTDPRPWVMVLEPWWCKPSSRCARISRPGKDLLQVPEERRIDGHHVFEMAVNGAVLDHQDLAIALDDLRFDLAGPVVIEDLERSLAIQDLLADLGDALGAQRIGLARPAQRRLHFLPRFEQRLLRPPGREASIRANPVEAVEDAQAAPAAYVRAFSAYLTGLCIGYESLPGRLKSRD